MLECIRTWPDRFAGFAYLGGMGQPDGADQLERLLKAGMLGLKVELPTTRRLRAEFRWDGEPERKLWARLERLGRPLWIDINGCDEADAAALERALDDHPRLRLMVCHVGGAPEGIWQRRALYSAASIRNSPPVSDCAINWRPVWSTDWPRSRVASRNSTATSLCIRSG